MQHLRAVIRELGCLTRVELRDHTRVGDDARIRGEQAGHVLPQRDRGRAQSASEQRRAQVRATAADGRNFAGGCAADEAGDDRAHRLVSLRRRAGHQERLAVAHQPFGDGGRTNRNDAFCSFASIRASTYICSAWSSTLTSR